MPIKSGLLKVLLVTLSCLSACSGFATVFTVDSNRFNISVADFEREERIYHSKNFRI